MWTFFFFDNHITVNVLKVVERAFITHHEFFFILKYSTLFVCHEKELTGDCKLVTFIQNSTTPRKDKYVKQGLKLLTKTADTLG